MEEKRYNRITDKKYVRLLFGLCWVVYFSTYIGRLNYSASLAEMIRAEGFSKGQAGIIGTGFFFAYGAGQLVSGFLGDRLSPKKMVFTGTLVSAVCNLAMTVLKTPGSMALVWCLNGLFQAFIWSPMIRLMFEYFNTETRTKCCVALNSSVPIGTMAAYGLTALFIQLGGWRSTFVLAFALLLGISILWLVFMGKVERHREDCQSQAGEETIAQKTSEDGKCPGSEAGKTPRKGGERINWGRLLWESGFAFLIIALFVQGALKDGVTTWVPTYISETYGVSSIMAITSTMVIPVFNLAGVYLASWVNLNWMRDEIRTAGVFFAVCSASLLILLTWSGKSIVLSFLMLAAATTAMMAVNTMLIALLPSYFGVIGRASSVSGLLNSFVYAGGAVSTYGIGTFSAYAGWNLTILSWCLAAIVAMLLCLLVWKRFAGYRKRVLRT